ncbi:MAG: PQQ-dependent sugar dehydrogenase [Candidatus Paceibacterota bacterium]|jgi:glucose/arabinose dehydrogenase
MKNNLKITIIVLAFIIIGVFIYYYKTKITPFNEGTPTTTESSIISLPGFQIPEGFLFSIFAKNVPGARAIELDPKGRVVVSETGEGKIVMLSDTNNDFITDEQKTLLSGLEKPHGLAFNCNNLNDACFLYVAEASTLSRYSYDAQTLILGPKEKLMEISSSLGDRHFTRSLLFLPSPNENTLLVSVGSSCDVCHEKDAEHATVLSYNIKTGKKEVYAKGLRNSVFMTLNPVSGKVFATEMGRDNLGDNLPPDEINIIEKGNNYGWPICYGKNIHDTKFDKNTYIRNPCMEPFETSSFIDLQAHSAPLGLSFIPKVGWPKEYQHNLLVAYHGSWNRSIPTGYKIVRLKMDAQGKYLGVEDFITGWMTNEGKKIGRPVDIEILPNGTAYISDDSSGAIYVLRVK